MHVAIVFHRLLPDRGGAERWTGDFIHWLSQRNHKIQLICSQFADTALPEIEPVLLPGLDRFEFAHRAADVVARLPVDVVHDMGFSYGSDLFQPHYGSQLALDHAKQSCYRGLSSWFNHCRRRYGWRSRQIASLVAQQYAQPTTRFLAVSRKVAHDIHTWHDVPYDRIDVVHNGVNIDQFAPAISVDERLDLRAQLGIQTRELVILTVAHNHRLKGVSRLTALLQKPEARARSIHLLVVGGHRQRPSTQEVNGNRITFAGMRSDVALFYAAADVYALATYYDACSLTVLEAMACGLPVITTTCNGASEIMQGELAELIVPHPDSQEDLWRSVVRCQDSSFRQVAGEAGRRVIQDYSLEKNFLAVEAIYHRLARLRAAA